MEKLRIGLILVNKQQRQQQHMLKGQLLISPFLNKFQALKSLGDKRAVSKIKQHMIRQEGLLNGHKIAQPFTRS